MYLCSITELQILYKLFTASYIIQNNKVQVKFLSYIGLKKKKKNVQFFGFRRFFTLFVKTKMLISIFELEKH